MEQQEEPAVNVLTNDTVNGSAVSLNKINLTTVTLTVI
jgi:hypothetical protein